MNFDLEGHYSDIRGNVYQVTDIQGNTVTLQIRMRPSMDGEWPLQLGTCFRLELFMPGEEEPFDTLPYAHQYMHKAMNYVRRHLGVSLECGIIVKCYNNVDGHECWSREL